MEKETTILTIIMQNKANFRKAQMNVNFTLQKDYENKPACRVQKNKANQSQFQDCTCEQKKAPRRNAGLEYQVTVKLSSERPDIRPRQNGRERSSISLERR